MLARFGGNWNNARNSGSSNWNLNNSSSNANVNNGRQTLINRSRCIICVLSPSPLGENQTERARPSSL